MPITKSNYIQQVDQQSFTALRSLEPMEVRVSQVVLGDLNSLNAGLKISSYWRKEPVNFLCVRVE